MRLFPSSEQTRAERLSRLDRFAGLTAKDVRRIVKAASTAQLSDGDVLVEEGTLGGSAYVVLSGELEVTQGGEVIGRMRPGDLVGEIGLVAAPRRSATVTALVDCELLELPGEVARELYEELPALQEALWEVAEKRLTRDRHTE
ncbi:MAG TPA: cyclic nucleotide-binding domain-containing protein [Nocardioidaceae bacterium]|nr:cyclic nucleotide-binding domain-containing protein [Nocardioidaceae bacterium]